MTTVTDRIHRTCIVSSRIECVSICGSSSLHVECVSCMFHVCFMYVSCMLLRNHDSCSNIHYLQIALARREKTRAVRNRNINDTSTTNDADGDDHWMTKLKCEWECAQIGVMEHFIPKKLGRIPDHTHSRLRKMDRTSDHKEFGLKKTFCIEMCSTCDL